MPHMCVMHAIMYVRHTVCAINICTHALTVYTLGQERNDAYTTGIDHARERAEQLAMLAVVSDFLSWAHCGCFLAVDLLWLLSCRGLAVVSGFLS